MDPSLKHCLDETEKEIDKIARKTSCSCVYLKVMIKDLVDKAQKMHDSINRTAVLEKWFYIFISVVVFFLWYLYLIIEDLIANIK
jgi:hypothetical protein